MTKKKLGLLLIIMGIMLIAAALSLNYYNYFHEKQSNKRMEAVLSDLKTQISDSSEDSDSSSPFDIFDDSRSTDSEIDDPDKDIVLDGNSYIGFIPDTGAGVSCDSWLELCCNEYCGLSVQRQTCRQ